MLSSNDVGRIEKSTAYDSTGDKVGKVGQIYLDDTTGDPSWVTVSTGMFGTSETFVPLEGASFDGDDLRLAHSKDKIKDAPRLDVDQHLSPQEENELYRYYGLESSFSGQETHTHDTGVATGTVGTTDTVGTTGTADTTRHTTDEAAVTLSEERLNVDKQSQEVGRARLRKYVTTDTETVTVPVKKEQLVVERNPVSETRSGGTISEGGDVEEITLREERAVVGKETVDVEEVRVGKETVTEQERVSEQVRKEHVEVEGDVDTTGTTGTTGTGGTGLGR
jgi:uncharacterized protein (TIGR02271 family)